MLETSILFSSNGFRSFLLHGCKKLKLTAKKLRLIYRKKKKTLKKLDEKILTRLK